MGTRLFIGNLSYNVNEQELRDAFASEGIEVRSVRVSLDRETGRPRGFAFVETLTDEGAKTSIEKLSGRILQGRAIVVEEAQARTGGPGGAAPGVGSGPPSPRPAGPAGVSSGARFGAPGAPAGSAPTGAGGAAGPPRAGFGTGQRPAGFGAPGAPRPGGFGSGPPGGGAPRPGGFGSGPPRSFGPPPIGGGAPRPSGDAPPRRDRPEKKKSTRPKPEEQERGNWRWNGKVDED